MPLPSIFVRALLRQSVNLLPMPLRRTVKHLPGIASIQQWIVNRLLSGETFIHRINAGPAKGLVLQIQLPADKGMWAGTYERAFGESLAKAVRPGDVCYDIGGYRGYMSGILALAGASNVLTFEPLPKNIAAIEGLLQLNPRLPIRLAKVAIGNRSGHVSFKVMADPSMGKLGDSPFQKGAPHLEEIEVQCARLDDLLKAGQIPVPDVIKIDVEGGELEVLKGAAELLANCKPEILVEAHSPALAQECISVLNSVGYNVTQIEAKVPGDEAPTHLVGSHPARRSRYGVGK